MKKKGLIISLIALILMILSASWYQSAFAPTESTVAVIPISDEQLTEVTIVAENLTIPWDVAGLPDGTLLVTERPGNIVVIKRDGTSTRITVPEVSAIGEGGLMGIALHPNFLTNRTIYLYRTVLRNEQRKNEIVHYTLTAELTLENETIILSSIPGARFHDGGALSFGPDGYLYVTTGDALEPPLAQDLTSLAGKILRITDTGEPAVGNPFNNHIYSYGHRNAQGLAFDESGQLWSTEHGRSGVQSGFDELNYIIPGGNYGWSDSQGDDVVTGTIAPVVHSGSAETWAPGGLAYYNGNLFFAGLRGERLYQVSVNNKTVSSISALFPETYGRLRASRVIGDFLYVTTSNTDGRGTAGPQDDKLIAIPLELLLARE